jgi:hypothetical protein
MALKNKGLIYVLATLVQVERDIALQRVEDVEAKYNDLRSKLNQLITG